MIYSGVTILLGLIFPHLEYRYLPGYNHGVRIPVAIDVVLSLSSGKQLAVTDVLVAAGRTGSLKLRHQSSICPLRLPCCTEASDSSEPPDQAASQGTSGRLKSGPTVVQALSSKPPSKAIPCVPSDFAGMPRIDSIFALRITPPGPLLLDVGISSHPLHEDLIAQCQQGRSDEHA
jgi:hypothetical protein